MSEAATADARAEAIAPLKLPAGFSSAAETANNTYARILLMGQAKAGKTTSVVATAPRPLVINADGVGSTKCARAINPDPVYPIEVQAHDRKSWEAAQKGAAELVKAGAVDTIIVDTISLLGEKLLEDIVLSGLENYDIWRAYHDAITRGYRKLARLPAHLIVIAHMNPREDEIAGMTPMIYGKAQAVLPAECDDWILLDYQPGRKPHERQFLLGAQEKWTHSGRNVKRTCAVEATIPALFQELGLPL